MADVTDVVNPKWLVVPKMTATARDLLVPELGTLIYNTTTNKLNFADGTAAGAGSWAAVTSA